MTITHCAGDSNESMRQVTCWCVPAPRSIRASLSKTSEAVRALFSCFTATRVPLESVPERTLPKAPSPSRAPSE